MAAPVQTSTRWEPEEVLDLVARKWTMMVIYMLRNEPKRYGELLRLVQGISRKVLTQTLRNLERSGVVRRELYPEVPPKVEYTLTPMGVSLLEAVMSVLGWAEDHLHQMRQAQAEYDRVKRTE